MKNHQFIGSNPIFITTYIVLGILSYFFLDRYVACFFHHLEWPISVQVTLNFITNLGLGWFYILGFPVAAFIAHEYFKKVNIARALIFLWLCVIFSSLSCDMIKIILGRARPDKFFEYHQYGFYWFQFNAYYWSFPSGHTSVIAAVMLGLRYLKPRWTLFFITMAIIISATRIVLTQHYISDVMAGFYNALVCVHILHAFYKKKRYNLPRF